MNQYTLTADELSQFSSDEFRSSLRQKLIVHYPEGVQILDGEGNLMDVLSAQEESNQTDLAVVLTDDEREEREQERERVRQEVDHYESEIKPLVIDRIRQEIRNEYSDEIRAKTNEVLKLRADFAKLKITSASSTNKLRQDVSKLEFGKLKAEKERDDDLRNHASEIQKLSESHLETLNELSELKKANEASIKELDSLKEHSKALEQLMEEASKPDTTPVSPSLDTLPISAKEDSK